MPTNSRDFRVMTHSQAKEVFLFPRPVPQCSGILFRAFEYSQNFVESGPRNCETKSTELLLSQPPSFPEGRWDLASSGTTLGLQQD